VPPWNFPVAIPAGGVLAALAAGSTVVLKPAPQAAACSALIADLCHLAGVPRAALRYLPAGDDEAGRRVVTHPDVDAVVFTGSTETATMFLGWRPDLRLHGETSGKNAIVVTATADLDHAVADIVRSAFSHAGQKCSAASLAIVEAPLHDDPAFLERLRDAASTMVTGPAHDPATDVGPLIDPPGERLHRALTVLDEGERWLLQPRRLDAAGTMWTPGIRVGVQPGSWFARTECFGPVLGVIRADDLTHAVAIQNATDFGLTAGLHALDPGEIRWWLDAVEAGNLYVDRGITGAIVRRQPFGGWKGSVVGPTYKAGGPNYVGGLMRWSDDGVPIDQVVTRWEAWMREVGNAEQEPSGLAVERNLFRYRPRPGIVVRVGPDTDVRSRALVDHAARITGARVVWSYSDREPATALAERLGGLGADRLRLLDTDPSAAQVLRRAAHAARIAVDDAPPVAAAEIELPRWLREQAVSVTWHRHGRVAPRWPATAASSVEAS
jgi:RHH-type proline utilization regulon transcriptional repressor/proline dehydrogenase/delta 1-pyrroline-5-carboxylate dehydrogenase